MADLEKQTKGQQRLGRILEAAAAVFSRKGYQDTAVDDIAAESETSKGGVYFHFPNKQAIFVALLDRMTALLRSRAEAAMTAEPDLTLKGDVALAVMLNTFQGHRSLARLFLVEALGAGPEVSTRLLQTHAEFSLLIRQYLDEAVAAGVIPPLDTQIASLAWFGAVNQVVTHWLLTGQPARLEDTYPALRQLLRAGVGFR